MLGKSIRTEENGSKFCLVKYISSAVLMDVDIYNLFLWYCRRVNRTNVSVSKYPASVAWQWLQVIASDS